MAHYAQLDENNVVLQVIVVHNSELVASKQTTVNEDGSIAVSVIESEDKGVEFCQSLFGADTRWVQTSYNGNFRGKYAGIGDIYDAETNEFRTSTEASSDDVLIIAPAIQTQQTVVLETQATIALETQATIVLESADISALISADIQALTSQQISGLE
jgi:hypothetical protein